MAWDWQVFLNDDGGGRTYLQWMFDAWGWTLSVAGCAWVVAVVVGALIGTLRTLPSSPWLVRFANAWVLGPLACVGGLTAFGLPLSGLPPELVNGGQLLLGVALGSRFSPSFFRAAPRFLGVSALATTPMPCK